MPIQLASNCVKVLAKNSELKNFVLTFSFVLMLSGAYAAPLWNPAEVGFLQTAGVSAVIVAKEMWSLFLMNPTLLLYNPDVQGFFKNVINGGARQHNNYKNRRRQLFI